MNVNNINRLSRKNTMEICRAGKHNTKKIAKLSKNLMINVTKSANLPKKDFLGKTHFNLKEVDKVKENHTSFCSLFMKIVHYIMIPIGVLLLSILLFFLFWRTSFSFPLHEELWNQDDILNEDNLRFIFHRIYKNQSCFKLDEVRYEESDIEPSKELENDLLDDYREYEGKLQYGNSIKQRLWIEVEYIRYVLAHSIPTDFLNKVHDGVYHHYSPDIELIKKNPNYPEINKIIESWVDKDPKDDFFHDSKQPRTFNTLIKQFIGEFENQNDMDGAKIELSNAIDQLLDHIEENKNKYNSNLKKHKIWTLNGLYRFFKEIDARDRLILWSKLKVILRAIVQTQLNSLYNSRSKSREHSIQFWISIFFFDEWELLKHPGYKNEEEIDVLLYNDQGTLVHPQIEEKLTQLAKDNDLYGELGNPTAQFKYENKEFFIEAFSILFTEAHDKFQLRKKYFEEHLTSLLLEFLCNGLRNQPKEENPG